MIFWLIDYWFTLNSTDPNQTEKTIKKAQIYKNGVLRLARALAYYGAKIFKKWIKEFKDENNLKLLKKKSINNSSILWYDY